MRTDDERIKAMHRRAAEIEREGRARRIRTIQAAAFAVCFAAVAGLAVCMSAISGSISPDGALQNMNGSIFAGSSMLGCLVIGIIAFILGVSVTVFCYQIRKLQTGAEEGTAADGEDSL